MDPVLYWGTALEACPPCNRRVPYLDESSMKPALYQGTALAGPYLAENM